jgi:hypothetical protein
LKQARLVNVKSRTQKWERRDSYMLSNVELSSIFIPHPTKGGVIFAASHPICEIPCFGSGIARVVKS